MVRLTTDGMVAGEEYGVTSFAKGDECLAVEHSKGSLTVTRRARLQVVLSLPIWRTSPSLMVEIRRALPARTERSGE